MRILVVEDSENTNEFITEGLRTDGYCVDTCFDGCEALDFLKVVQYDAIILDIMMPRLDGREVLKQLRSHGDYTPVMLLTSCDKIEERVLGLDLGANDYMIKPFHIAELLARVRVITRASIGKLSNIYQLADLTMDCCQRTVFRGEQEIFLTTKEFSLLECLFRNQGRPVNNQMIENNIWNFPCDRNAEGVKVYISYLRKKIDEKFEPKLIHTVRGQGYVLKIM